MTSKIREYQSFLYILGAAIGVVLFVLTSNELIFKSSALPGLSSLGNWGYWVFTLGLVMMIAFFYLYYRLLSDTKKFETLINSESKNTFSKNLRELDRISKKLGPRYVTELKETKEKWKLR
ncbi:hypothetical protein IX51_00790 [uncultured archaeon]|nr:hypothetical protein IX51_00790 [uncultured archaeon]